MSSAFSKCLCGMTVWHFIGSDNLWLSVLVFDTITLTRSNRGPLMNCSLIRMYKLQGQIKPGKVSTNHICRAQQAATTTPWYDCAVWAAATWSMSQTHSCNSLISLKNNKIIINGTNRLVKWPTVNPITTVTTTHYKLLIEIQPDGLHNQLFNSITYTTICVIFFYFADF